jgi:hypothetical protein
MAVPPSSRRERAARRTTPARYSLESYNAKGSPVDRHKIAGAQFDSAAEAVVAARRLIDEQLRASLAEGRTAEEALENWSCVGDVPVVVEIHTEARQVAFDAHSYATSQVQLIAGGLA